MQNKGAIRLFAILLGLICVYQLMFTYQASDVEKKAKEFAKGDKQKELTYLDSMSSEVVYNLLGIKKYTYKEVKELELGLGLDLKGGMNVTLEVKVVDLIKSLSNFSKDSTFNSAIRLAVEKQENSQEDFVTLFGKAFEQVSPNGKLASIFNTLELKDQIKYNSTNAEVLDVLRKETKIAIDNSFNIIRTRIDRFGVAQPNIQPLQTAGRILVELPGIDDPKRVRKLLQGTANLEFWETFDNSEVFQYLAAVNQKLVEIQSIKTQPTTAISTDTTKIQADAGKANSLLSELDKKAATDSVSAKQADINKQYPLFSVLIPNQTNQGQMLNGPIVGTSHAKDTATVNNYLKLDQVKALLPRNLAFKWTAKAVDDKETLFQLIAIKVTSRDGRAPLEGDVITDARQDYSDMGSRPEVSMSMNSEGAKVWARMTKENVGKSIAIVLDGYVRSFPNVNGEITGGRSSITGLESVEEAKDLANILKSGKMPAPAVIIAEDIVGPSLGREAINSGMWSFVIAFLLVLAYMLFFYSKKAGMAANIALLVNVFFLIGVLASLGAVLTLPGIAGIVLTMGMAVDANVLIYERIQEEINGGKGLRLAVNDGYNAAYSAIIDGQVTTLLTGVVLYLFGSGPIKGFATTLIIGILTSMFTAIFISRLIFERQMGKNKTITFTAKVTSDWLRHTKIPFLGKRKLFYMISGSLIVISLISFVTRGFHAGIDFKGGRTYVVRFEKDVLVSEVQNALTTAFNNNTPEVKSYGNANQVRITTTYKINDLSENVDNEVEELMYNGLKSAGFIGDVSLDTFIKVNRMSSQKVGPTISDDIKKDAAIAIFLSLLMIFLYILIRFRNWQYGLGGIIALAHDAIITLGAFSLLYGILPFNLEIDQAFIAAILTVIGYSINDTVIVYDRVREYLHLYPKRKLDDNMDHAMNSTLRRTFSTSLSTLVVLFAIFVFGGTSIQGFTFALLIGIGVGTYSSVFVATPFVYDTIKKFKKD